MTHVIQVQWVLRFQSFVVPLDLEPLPFFFPSPLPLISWSPFSGVADEGIDTRCDVFNRMVLSVPVRFTLSA